MSSFPNKMYKNIIVSWNSALLFCNNDNMPIRISDIAKFCNCETPKLQNFENTKVDISSFLLFTCIVINSIKYDYYNAKILCKCWKVGEFNFR